MELRLYSFVNFYLSPMQKGIQTGHAAVDLTLKYSTAKPGMSEEYAQKSLLVSNWAKYNKTFIVLEGGNSGALLNATQIISKSDFPYTIFCEDANSLAGLHTCTAVILPDYIFGARLMEDGVTYMYQHPTYPSMNTKFCPGEKNYDLIKLVTSSRLAV
jgi:hypothetical protein